MNGHQMTIEAAVESGRQAAQAAEMAAGPEFAHAADAFLRAFAARADRPFASEDVVRAAADAGLLCEEQRAWGTVFRRAERGGLIRRTGDVFRRRFGHGAPSLKWEVRR